MTIYRIIKKIFYPPIYGHVDNVREGVVNGWAFNSTNNDKKVAIEIICNGKLVGTTIANRYRKDLKELSIGDGYCGFKCLIDVQSSINGKVTVRANGRTLKKNNLFHKINNYKQNYVTTFIKRIKHANNRIIINIDNASIIDENIIIIKGWALAKSNIKKIEIYYGDECIGLANYGQSRPDVAKAHPRFSNANYSGFYFLRNISFYESVHRTTIRICNKTEQSIEKTIILKKNDYSELSLDEQYLIFLEQNKLFSKDVSRINNKCNGFKYQPLISIVTPVYNVAPIWLDKCIESVLNQYYQNWELCLHDDKSTSQETIDCLKKWSNIDKRIKISFGEKNGNISYASNQAIKLTTGEFIGLLDHDDVLTPDALYENVKALNNNKQLDLIYSDEDKLEMNGDRTGPYFKSDFNIDLLRSNNYICHFTVIRKSVGDKVAWFTEGLEGSQDHDLFLKVIDQINQKNIHHIPKVIYSWRKVPGSTAAVYDDKNYAFEAGKLALENHLLRNNITGEVQKTKRGGVYRIIRKIETPKLVSIIIPFRDKVELLQTCLDSIKNKTKYTNYEILLVNNNSIEQKTRDFLKELKYNQHILILNFNGEFNYSKINNWAVKQAKGDYILFLNNDTEVITDGWLSNMVQDIQRDDVGAVGCRLLYADHTIQHAGIVVGINGVAGHIFNGLDKSFIHHFSYGVPKNVTACTAACLLTKKALFTELNGFDEDNLKIAFNDIDYCLKIRKHDLLILYTPHTELYHFESKSRGYEDTDEKIFRFKQEIDFIKKKWNLNDYRDPYYNINHSKQRTDYKIY
ncbi:MAG: glycosyltransferase family 2 protein [Methylococcales bacterium]